MARLNATHAYRVMVLMRRFEEGVGAASESGEIHGENHLAIGQEAISAALSVLLADGDAVVSTHRPHLHALAHRVDPVAMLAEVLEREGLCGGKGGHMHLFDPQRKFMCTGIVAAGAPIAAGYAFAQRSQGEDVTVSVLGDGAMNQGAFFETANLAALLRLPLIFLCEDNGYGISVRRQDAAAGALEDRGVPFGIPGERCDGTDPDAVFAVLDPAFARARRREGPSLVVAEAYRYRGHYEGDLDGYRPREEKELAMSPARDPVARLRTRLLEEGATEDELVDIEVSAGEQVEAWMRAARERPFPSLERLREDIFV
jgi:acetoin:2,6-dichlorophenolindophenol oxidoreductase subunit alpha